MRGCLRAEELTGGPTSGARRFTWQNGRPTELLEGPRGPLAVWNVLGLAASRRATDRGVSGVISLQVVLRMRVIRRAVIYVGLLTGRRGDVREL